MDLNTFRDLISQLKEKGINYKASEKIYNPIEFFLEKLVQKELAHSKLIADLLNPNGNHGQGDLFLDSFLKTLGLRDLSTYDIDLCKTEIRTEYGISTVWDDSKGEKVNGRIDIFLRLKDKSGKTIASLIIENKLNGAPFGKDQLEKYRKAINEEEASDVKVYVVTLTTPLLNKIDGADVTLTCLKVAEFIEKALYDRHTTISDSLKCYINYLKNIDMYENALKNASSLVDNQITSEEIKKMKCIKEAYEQLPRAYAEKFYNIMKTQDNKGPEVEKSASYPAYVDIWKPEANAGKDMSWRWLSVGFYHDSAYFYLVCNRRTDDDVKRYAELAGFEKSSKSGGWTWHTSKYGTRLLNYSERTENPGVPDFEEIKKHALELIGELDKADHEFNQ